MNVRFGSLTDMSAFGQKRTLDRYKKPGHEGSGFRSWNSNGQLISFFPFIAAIRTILQARDIPVALLPQDIPILFPAHQIFKVLLKGGNLITEIHPIDALLGIGYLILVIAILTKTILLVIQFFIK